MRPFKKSIFAQDNPPSVLFKYSKNKSVNLIIHNNDYTVNRYSNSWSISSKTLDIDNIPNLKMIGDYQYNYAAASVVALNNILPECLSDKELIKESLCNTTIAGRFQYLQHSPQIMLDVAHNEDAAKSLAKKIKKLNYKKYSFSKNKKVFEVIKNRYPLNTYFLQNYHIN